MMTEINDDDRDQSRRPKSIITTKINDGDWDQWWWPRSMMATEISDNDIHTILLKCVHVLDITTRKHYRKGIYISAIIDDIRLLHVPRLRHTQIYRNTDEITCSWTYATTHIYRNGSWIWLRIRGKKEHKVVKTSKQFSTSSKRLPNDLRKHQRLLCEYQLIHPYDHCKKSPPISYIYSPFRPAFTATAMQTTIFIIYEPQLDWK
jgi:hypothetical protein